MKKKCISQHRSLFSTSERFIRLNKLDWTLSNIRSVIQRISQYSIRHKNVTWCEEVREMTLHLMSYQDFNADTLKFLAELIDHGCEVNGALCQIMGVAWTKLQDGRANMWKHPLISLHLLRNLLLHGPLTAITEITDGINHIRALKNYTSNRSPDNGKSVRVTASEVYNLIIDRMSLFNQRKQLACKRLKLGTVDAKDRKWLDYMVRRLPVPVDFKTIHKLVKPKPGRRPDEESEAGSGTSSNFDRMPHNDNEYEDVESDQDMQDNEAFEPFPNRPMEDDLPDEDVHDDDELHHNYEQDAEGAYAL